MKFGGTSVGGADAIRRVGKIIEGVLEREPVVVVSAVGGITDRLFTLASAAVSGGDWEAAYEVVGQKHLEILEELDLPARLLDELLGELHGLARGISLIRELTARTRDYLVSFGERLSARVVAAHLRERGIESLALDAFDAGLLTDSRFGGALPLADTDERIRAALAGVSGVPVVTGYIAKDAAGSITTLGRGGSDFSASIFGAALAAEEIQIWTDVDGVMSADPRLVDRARHLPRISFAEASELAFYGAKVVHPATMVPAVSRGIPIRVLNTYRPEFEGTTIVGELGPAERGVKSITSKKSISVITVVAPPMALQYGFLERIGDVFKRREIVIDMIATSEVSVALTTSSVSLTTEGGGSLEAAVRDLEEFSEVEVRHGMAQLSVVGEEIRDRVGFAAGVFDVLRRLGINAEMISFGATRINLSFVVARDQVQPAIQGLHEHLFGA